MSSTPKPNNFDIGVPQVIPQRLKCKYAQTNCYRERAYKLSGGRHKLCAHHRMHANEAQRRFSLRKRQERQQQSLYRREQNISTGTSIGTENLSGIAALTSESLYHPCDLIRSGEIIGENFEQKENIPSDEEMYEWLIDVLLEADC